MNRKYLPLILMLVAGAITSIVTFIMKYPLVWMLVALLVVFIIFYILGSVIKWLLDTFDRQNAKAALDEGEVIEKEGDGETETEAGQTTEEEK